MFILYMSPNIILSIALIITMNTLVKHFVRDSGGCEHYLGSQKTEHCSRKDVFLAGWCAPGVHTGTRAHRRFWYGEISCKYGEISLTVSMVKFYSYAPKSEPWVHM